MKPADFARTIDSLGLSQVGAARLLGVDGRTVRRWVAGDREIPPTVDRFLLLLVTFEITPAAVIERLGLSR